MVKKSDKSGTDKSSTVEKPEVKAAPAPAPVKKSGKKAASVVAIVSRANYPITIDYGVNKIVIPPKGRINQLNVAMLPKSLPHELRSIKQQ